MKLFLSVVIVLGLLGCSTAISVPACAFALNYNLFNLCPFSDLTFNASANASWSEISSVTFSPVTPEVPSATNASNMVYAQSVLAAGLVETDIAIADAALSFINSNDPSQGLVLTFPQVNGTLIDYQFIVNLHCNSDDTDAASTNFTLNSLNISSVGLNTVTVDGYTSAACPVASFDAVINFIIANKLIFIIVFSVVGLLIAFFGLKLFHCVVFVIAVVVVTGIIFFLTAKLIPENPKTWILWLILAVSLGLGLVAGYFSIRLPSIGHFLIGGALGAVGGLVLYNAVISPFVDSSDGSTILVIVLLLTTLIGGIAGIYLIESIMIIATSIIGAYMSIRAISFLIGHFPLETDIASGYKQFDAAAYAYLSAMVVVAGFGMYFQFKMKEKAEIHAAAFKDEYQ